MSHYCKICGRSRANEAFSGKGHRDHVCRDCSRIPAKERQGVEQEDEIFGFLMQSHISATNMSCLEALMSSSNPRVAELAGIVFEVAQVKPHKKRRLQVLARERRDPLARMEETGLIFAHHC